MYNACPTVTVSVVVHTYGHVTDITYATLTVSSAVKYPSHRGSRGFSLILYVCTHTHTHTHTYTHICVWFLVVLRANNDFFANTLILCFNVVCTVDHVSICR